MESLLTFLSPFVTENVLSCPLTLQYLRCPFPSPLGRRFSEFILFCRSESWTFSEVNRGGFDVRFSHFYFFCVLGEKFHGRLWKLSSGQRINHFTSPCLDDDFFLQLCPLKSLFRDWNCFIYWTGQEIIWDQLYYSIYWH